MSISTPEAARAVSAKATAGKLTLQLEDGRTLSVPLKLFPRLRDATPAKLADLRLVARGIGIHWPQLDEDLSVRGLLTAEPLPELLAPLRPAPVISKRRSPAQAPRLAAYPIRRAGSR